MSGVLLVGIVGRGGGALDLGCSLGGFAGFLGVYCRMGGYLRGRKLGMEFGGLSEGRLSWFVPVS